MKKFLTIATLGLSMCSSGFAETTEIELANSLVWEVTGPGIEEPSYLVGTMHIMCEKDFKIDSRIHAAMGKSKQLFLEFDYDDPNEMLELQQSMIVKESLKDRLTPEQYAQMEDIFKKYTNFKIDAFDKASLLTIQSAILVSALKCPSKMLDSELMSLAHAQSIPVHGLETIAFQLETVAKAFPLSDKVMTEEELEVFYNLGEVFDQMVKTYLSEDIDEMKQSFDEQMNVLENSDEAIKLMLDVRNQNWVKRIPAIADEQATTFAFGAGHLAGEQGVINLLRDAGLTVTPIME